jgi:hypothetical protein
VVVVAVVVPIHQLDEMEEVAVVPEQTILLLHPEEQALPDKVIMVVHLLVIKIIMLVVVVALAL